MLRIESVRLDDVVEVLKVEGRVTGPWVNELRRSCAERLGRRRQLVLDLGGVSFADRDGAALLRELIERGVVLSHCSAFLLDQVQQPRV